MQESEKKGFHLSNGNSFENYLSFGYVCSIARSLEESGLRDASFPFDWLQSDLEGILSLLKDHFDDFLNPKYLYQHETIKENYYNAKYRCWFFHDFDQYQPLKEQLLSVTGKYNKRIQRLYDTITKPTLFLRYLSSQDKDDHGKPYELSYLESNYDKILTFLKSFNPDNELLLLANDDVTSDILHLHHVSPDKNLLYTEHPFEKNQELKTYFSSLAYPKRKQNRKHYLKKNYAFLAKLKRKEKKLKLFFTAKPYTHSQTMKELKN